MGRFLLNPLVALMSGGLFSLAQAATDSTTAIADAFVANGPTGNLGANNYGGGGALAVAAGDLPNGEFQTVLKFDLSGVRSAFDSQFGSGQWSVQSISLQLSSSPHNNAIYNNIAAGSFDISLMQNNSWVEGTGTAGNPTSDGISFITLQSTFINNANDRALGTFSFGGGTSGANSYNLGLVTDLNNDILGGNDVSLRLFAADNTVSYLFSSRSAADPSSRPDLIIVAVPEPRSLTLLGAGLAALMVVRRRFRVGTLSVP